jgi:very-short-patch-repair endonuclease
VDTITRLLSTDGLILIREHRRLKWAVYEAWHAGRLRRLHPGVFTGPGPVPESLRLRALSRWAPRAAIHGSTAAALWLGEWSGGRVELATPVHLVAPPWVVLTHRRVPANQVRVREGIRLVDPAYAAAELAGSDGGRSAMRMFAAGITTPREVAAAATWLADTPGNEERRRILADLERNPWSPAELLLHQLLRDAGVVGWVANPALRIEGAVIRPDVLLAAARLVLEVDGWAFHGGREEFQRDRDRQNALTSAGYRVLRFTWQDLSERPNEVLKRIRRTLSRTNLHGDAASGT